MNFVATSPALFAVLFSISSLAAQAEPFAYAANEKSGTVSIIDTATDQVVQRGAFCGHAGHAGSALPVA